MKIRVLLFGISALSVVGAVTLTGCHANLKLYPVQGPLAQLSPPPSYTIKITGGIKPDHFYAVLADGEKASCDFHNTSGKEAASAPFKIAPAWDAVYGDKYYEGRVLGSPRPYHWCEAAGEKATTLEVAVYEEEPREHDDSATQRVKGVAQDNKGNIFKFSM